METLPVWRNMLDIYGSQEFEVPPHLERIEFKVEKVVGTNQGLLIGYQIPSRES